MGKKAAFALFSLGVFAVVLGSIGLLFSSRQVAKPEALASAPINSPNPAPIVIVPPPAPGENSTPSPSDPKSAKNSTDMSAQEQSDLAGQLRRSDDENIRQAAIGRIRIMSQNDVRNLALGWTQWAQPMLDAKQYDDVEKMSLQAILDRPFDVGVVEGAQRARVLALMAEEKYPQALKEAKSYYNVASLADSPEAIGFLEKILAKTADASVATGFRLQQIAAAESGSAAAPTTNPSSGFNSDSPPASATDAAAKGGILASITIDPAPYTDKFTDLQDHGGGRNTNLMGEGNLLLLSDQPAEARGCFEAACKNSGTNAKRLREALEGVARAIRAQQASVSAANDFISSIRHNPALMAEFTPSKAPTAMRDAAQNTPLAQVQEMMTVPPLEQERLQNENLSDASAGNVQITSGFESSSPLTIAKISQTHFRISLTTPNSPNWFLFRIDGAANKIVRIDLVGADAYKWRSLNPLYTYSKSLDDPLTYAIKDVKHQDAKTISAWNGSLLPDTGSQSWHFIENVWLEGMAKVSFVQRCEADTVYIAMHVPYTPGYNSRYLESIAADPNIKLHNIGFSKNGRPLSVVEIGSGKSTMTPCVLIYAREHANEQDSSWAAQGAIDFLRSSDPRAVQIRVRTTFLVIPILDPDGAASGVYQNVINSFLFTPSPESNAYGRFILNWVAAGNRLDMVINLHNIEAGENPCNVFCPLLNTERDNKAAMISFDNQLCVKLNVDGYFAPDRFLAVNNDSTARFGGLIALRFGAFHVLYEINTQCLRHHLNISDTKKIGEEFVEVADGYLHSVSGTQLCEGVDRVRAVVAKNLNNYDLNDSRTMDIPLQVAASLGGAQVK